MKSVDLFLIYGFLKYFGAIFFGLVLFYIGMDYMQVYSKLPESANMHVLYLFYNGFQAMGLLLPLSIVFSFVAFILKITKSNELVAIYSFGFSKKRVLKPLFIVSIAISILYMGLNFTDAAYSKERYLKILKGNYFTSFRDELFLKYQNSYVYFGKLYPLQNRAENIKIFELKDGKLYRYIEADEAKFVNNTWSVEKAKITTKPIDVKIGEVGLKHEIKSDYSILNGFKPRIINSVYEESSISFSMSISDAFRSLSLLNSQEINSDKVRLHLYTMLVTPLFASLLMVIFFNYIPNSSRDNSGVVFGSITTFVSLITWGVFFILANLAFSGTITPEYAVLTPMAIIMFLSLFSYRKI